MPRTVAPRPRKGRPRKSEKRKGRSRTPFNPSSTTIRGPMDFYISSSSSYLSLTPTPSLRRPLPVQPQPSLRTSPPQAFDRENTTRFLPILPLLPSDNSPEPLVEETPQYQAESSQACLLPDGGSLRSQDTPGARELPFGSSPPPTLNKGVAPIAWEDTRGSTSTGQPLPRETSDEETILRPQESPRNTDLDQEPDLLRLPPQPVEVCEIAKVIFRQIQAGLIGCSALQHQFQAAAHYVHAQENHFPLEATFARVDTFSPKVGLWQDNFQQSQGVARRSIAPSAALLAELYCGIDTPTSQPKNICLHLEQPTATFPHASADVDSLIAFPTSLQALRTEFYYCPTLQFKRKITTDVHIQRTIFFPSLLGPDRQATLHLREIPHLYLGPIAGIYDCSVYIFFPRLFSKDYIFTELTNEQMHRFTDYIMLKSIYEHLPDVAVQHMPPGFQASQLNASAQANEMRTGAQDSSSKTHPTYLIQSAFLGPLWESIKSRAAEASLQEFADAFLCIISKGHKLQFQGQDSFPSMARTFYKKLETMFDYQFLCHNDIYIDIATEISPNYSSYNSEEDSEAQVYLFKKCCLERSLQAFYGTLSTKLPGTTQFFNVKFLDQACNMTHVPPKKSNVFQAGVRYIQCYAVEKEMSDAGTVYPFANPNLAELCLDPIIWTSAASAAKWTGKKSREVLVESYRRSKHRVRCLYHESRAKSFAARVEYRITSTLLLSVLDQYRQQEIADQLELKLPAWDRTPSFAWAIETPRYVDYVLGNVHKLCAAIEAITLIAPKDGIRQGQSNLLYGLFQCLRFFFSRSSMQVHPSLWYDKRESEGITRCGLGFESTMPQTGYCWFLPVVDWDRFQFTEEISPYFVIDPKAILGFDWTTREARNASWQLDDVLEHLPKAAAVPALQGRIVELLYHLCFRRYRQDVLHLLANECLLGPLETRNCIENDTITFCYQDLTDYFGNLHLASGNRTKIRSPLDMFNALWTTSPAFNRKHFKDKSYRRMYEKAWRALQPYPAMLQEWETSFPHHFFTFHSIVPLPDGNGTLISTAKHSKARTWWSVIGEGRYTWGRSRYASTRIDPYPSSLSMTKEQLERYLTSP